MPKMPAIIVEAPGHGVVWVGDEALVADEEGARGGEGEMNEMNGDRRKEGLWTRALRATLFEFLGGAAPRVNPLLGLARPVILGGQSWTTGQCAHRVWRPSPTVW